MLGFSGMRVAAIAAALVMFVPAMFAAGVMGIVVTSPFWAGLLASAFVRWGGRPLIETAPTGAHFAARHLAGQTAFTARPCAPRPAGTLALPGDAAALRFHVDDVSGAVMVHDPHAQTLTAVAHISHPAFVLLSPDNQRRRMIGWSRVLAGLASSGTCARLQVLETSLPDAGHGVVGWWREHGCHDERQWAVRQYDSLMADAAPSASTHRTLLAIVLDLKRAAKTVREAGRGMAGAAAVMRQDMAAMEASVRAAELSLDRWLDERELATVIRGCYDPVTADAISGSGVGGQLATAGPLGVEESWGHLRHDSGFSTVLWISEWPRIDVAPSFLHALIFEPGVRKTLTILATPLSTEQAMRDIRRQKVEYVSDAGQKAKIGQLADLADAQEYQDVIDRERALIAGHADLKFSGFIAVTAPTLDALQVAVSQIERAATQCACETRILYGQQAQAFTVAALPLGRKAG